MRKWIALVTSDPEATADFVAHIDEMKLQALNDIVDSPDDVVPTIRGTIKALKDLRFHVTAAVNEERQRARRPVAAA